MSNMLNRFRKTTAPAAAPAPAAPPPAAALPAAPTGVLAKDAPASNPAIAAQPPKERRLKLQDVSVEEDAEIVAAPAPAAPAPAAPAPAAPAPAAPAPAALQGEVVVKRGPGRPRKDGTPAQPKAETQASDATEPVLEYTNLTIRHGLTVNLGDRNFGKVEVEIGARFKGIDIEVVRKQLGDFARKAVDTELEQYAQAMDQAKT